MRRWLALSLVSIITNVFACDVRDDTGVLIHLDQSATHIVSLAPDDTEILFAINAGNKVVGVIKGSDFPSAANKLPIVGSYSGIDIERIVSLHPDLIVVWGQTFSRAIQSLKKLGIPVYVTDSKQLKDIPHTMENLSCLTGTQKSAQIAIQAFNSKLQQLHQQYSDQKPIRVFYQLGDYSLMTINRNSWINQVITLCGGKNVFANAKTTAPEVSWEAVVGANPQVIISDSKDPNWKARWQKWPEIEAVKKGRLYSINPDLLERASPRLVEGAEQMCRHIII